MLDDNEFSRNEKDLFETQIHLGGRYFSYYIDDGFKIKYITANRGFITKSVQNKPTEAVFVSTKTQMENIGIGSKLKKVYYTLLEWHYEEDGKRIIKNDLYRSTSKGELGRQRNEFITQVYGELVDTDEQVYDISIPTFVYIKNPIKNNKDLNSVEGLGAFINPIDSLMFVDETYDAMSQEIVYGTMKTMTPEGATEAVQDYEGNGTFRHYNPSDPNILVYSTNGDELGSYEPKAFNPQLRIQDQNIALSTGLDLVATGVGTDPGTFRFDGKSNVTATQAKIEKGDTANTIKLYEQNNTDGFKDLAMLWQEVSNSESNLDNVASFERKDITIVWKDNVIEDDETMKENDRKVVEAGLAAKYWYWTERGLDKTAAEERIKEAKEERMADEASLFATDDEIDDSTPDGEPNNQTDDTNETTENDDDKMETKNNPLPHLKKDEKQDDK